MNEIVLWKSQQQAFHKATPGIFWFADFDHHSSTSPQYNSTMGWGGDMGIWASRFPYVLLPVPALSLADSASLCFSYCEI